MTLSKQSPASATWFPHLKENVMKTRFAFFMVLTLVSTFVSTLTYGHGEVAPYTDWPERKISFPDTPEYKTLVVDLHTHSAFSDGHVWPQIRLAEADRDGLDALAVTEHLEWQPHLADLPHPDRNRAFEVTDQASKKLDLLIIPGAEITREKPAGHMNAVFISDANTLLKVDAEVTDPSDTVAYYTKAGEWPAQEAVEAANKQGAFVFWNHPFWGRQQPDGKATLNDFHKRNAKKGLLHGIEAANGNSYSAEAFEIALKHDLTIIGVSDVHNLIDYDYPPREGKHRPVTLVFAQERSLDGIKQALFAGRTVVWFKNLLFGRKQHVLPLLEASLTTSSKHYIGDGLITRTWIHNNSDARFILTNETKYTFVGMADTFEVPPHSRIKLGVKAGKQVKEIKLKFTVENALVAPKKKAAIQFDVRIPEKPAS